MGNNTFTSKQLAFENYERTEKIEGSSEKSFGLVFAGVFLLVGILKYDGTLEKSTPWFMMASLLGFLSFAFPQILKPFNKLWTLFGLLLHRIMNPIVMGLLFYGILTPTALLARCFKWDPLRLRCNSLEKTYWISREATQTNLKNQF